MTKVASTHVELLQRDIHAFENITGKDVYEAQDIAVWALENDMWTPPRDLLLKACKADYARAMREEYIKNDDGRPVRAKHVARIRKGKVQQYLWADIRNAPRKHMEIAFAQRREQIVGDCRQLKRDVDYYNGLHPKAKPIQQYFDFTDDVAEGDYSGDFRPKNPR